MKKILYLILIVFLLSLTSCIQNQDNYLENNFYLHQLENENISFNIIDETSYYGVWNINICRKLFENTYADHELFILTINNNAYDIKQNPFDKNILEILIKDDNYSKEDILNSTILKRRDSNQLTTKSTNEIGISYLYIDNYGEKNYRISYNTFFSLRNIRDFVVNHSDGSYLIPQYIESTNNKVYKFSGEGSYLDAKSNTENNTVNSAFQKLEKHPSLKINNLEHIKLWTESGVIKTEEDNRHIKLKYLGKEGNLGNDEFAINIKDNTEHFDRYDVVIRNSRISLAFRIGSLIGLKLKINENTYYFKINPYNLDYYELSIPKKDLENESDPINVIRNTMIYSLKEFGGGTGTKENPYLVATGYHLDNVRNHLDKHFKQIADIDLSNYDNWDSIGYFNFDTDLNNPNNAFFSGTYNGNNYNIKNLTIKTNEYEPVGLFSFITDNAKIENVYLKNINIEAIAGGIGGLVGVAYSNATIINCHVAGNIKGEYGDLGGLIGVIYVINEDQKVLVTNSSFNGILKGNNHIGGLISTIVCGNKAEIIIQSSYSKGLIEGKGNLGGLVGSAEVCRESEAIIQSSYSTVSVYGLNRVGGLIGFNYGTNLINSYATGYLEGDNNVGGLIGYVATYNQIINSYYDKNSTGQTDTGNGIPKSTEEMLKKETFEDWDFDNIWDIKEGQSYPFLRWQGEPNENNIPTFFNISGKILDEDNKPVSGVTVEIIEYSISIETDLEGKWYFNNLRGKSTIVPSKIGYAFNPVSYIVEEDSDDLIFIAKKATTISDIDIYNEIKDIKIEYGTKKDEVISKLPETIVIRDTTDATHTVVLSWEIDNYNSTRPATYLAVGSFDLPEGIYLAYPETESKVRSIITLLNIQDVTDLIEYLGGRFISSDITITEEFSPYYISNSIKVEENVLLTIEPGVVFLFDDNKHLFVEGYINALGTTLKPIIFKPALNENNEEGHFEIKIFSDPFTMKTNHSVDGINISTNNMNNKTKMEDLIKQEIKDTIRKLENREFNDLSKKDLMNYDLKRFETNYINPIIDYNFNIQNNEEENLNILKNIKIINGSLENTGRIEISDSEFAIITSNGNTIANNITAKSISGNYTMINAIVTEGFADLNGYFKNVNITGNYNFDSSYILNSEITGRTSLNNSIIEKTIINFRNDSSSWYQQSSVNGSKIIFSELKDSNYLLIAGSIIISSDITNNHDIRVRNNMSYIVFSNITDNENVGLTIETNNVFFSHNNFSNHSDYHIRLAGNAIGGEIEAQNNYWGSDNKQNIKNKIYDYEQDPNFELSKVNFEPFSIDYIQRSEEIIELDSIISGDIYESSRLIKANSPYILKDNLRIFGRLEIEPGVEIKVDRDKQIEVFGVINFTGTHSEPIIFRTNTGVNLKDMWRGIIFHSSNENAVIFEHVNIYNTSTGITLNNSTVELNNVFIDQTTTGINGNNNSKLTLNNATIKNSTSNDLSSIRNLIMDNSDIGRIVGGTDFSIYNSKINNLSYSWVQDSNILKNVEINIFYINNLYSSNMIIKDNIINSFQIRYIYSDNLILEDNTFNSLNLACYQMNDSSQIDLFNNNINNLLIFRDEWGNGPFGRGIINIKDNNITGYIGISSNNSESTAKILFENNKMINSNFTLYNVGEINILANEFINSNLDIYNDLTTRVRYNTFKDGLNHSMSIYGKFTMPSISNNTFYGNDGYAIVINDGTVADFNNNYIALNLGGIQVNRLVNEEFDLSLSENNIIMNRDFNILNNTNNNIIVDDNFWGLHTKQSILETIQGKVELNNFKSELIVSAGSDEVPELEDVLSFTNLGDYLVNNNTIDESNSPYIVTNDLTAENITVQGNIEIRITDGRTLNLKDLTEDNSQITFKPLYERNTPSAITKAIIKSNLQNVIAEGITVILESDINQIILKTAQLEGNNYNSNKIYTQGNNSSIIRSIQTEELLIEENSKLTRVTAETATIQNIQELKINNSTIIDYNLSDIEDVEINSSNISNSNFNNINKIEINNSSLLENVLTDTNVIINSSYVEENEFNNSPLENKNTKLFYNIFKNANTAIKVTQADDEDSVYIMKNVFEGNTKDILSTVNQLINAQYNYFEGSEPTKIEGNIDTSNYLLEKPTKEEVVLGHDISGKIILNSVIKTSSDPYIIRGDLLILGRLTIEPGTQLLMHDGEKIIVDGELVIKSGNMVRTNFDIEINGKLIVEEGSILGIARDKRITLNGDLDSRGTLSNRAIIKSGLGIDAHGLWEGVIIPFNWDSSDEKTFYFNNLIIENTNYAITLNNSELELNNVIVNLSTEGITTSGNSKLRIIDSQIDKTVRLYNDANIYANDSIIDSFEYYSGYSGKLELLNSEINNIYINNLYSQNNIIRNVESENVEINRCYNNSKIKILDSNVSELRVNNLYNNSQAIIKNNTIDYFRNSSVQNESNLTIEENDIRRMDMLTSSGDYTGKLNVLKNEIIGDVLIGPSGNNNVINIVNFKDNIFKNEAQLVVRSINRVNILNNEFLNGYQLRIQNSRNTFIKENTFKDSNRDALIISDYMTMPEISSNIFYGNEGYAVVVEDGLLAGFTNNYIVSNKGGIKFEKATSNMNFINNHFDNEEYNIYNDSDKTITANDNYWGTIIQEEINQKLFGNVIVDTWLDESNVNGD